MFEKIKKWGEHEIYNYDTNSNNFLQKGWNQYKKVIIYNN